jgi:uncharacterized membrane protein
MIKTVYCSKMNVTICGGLPERQRKAVCFMQSSYLSPNEAPDQDNPVLSKVIERNIRTIIRLFTKDAQRRSPQSRIADAIAFFSGWMVFVYGHIAWFGLWILLNTGRLGGQVFGPFLYGLLILFVCWEVIFLSKLVPIRQNHLSEEKDQPDTLELPIGLLVEHELTRVLQMVDAVHGRSGIMRIANEPTLKWEPCRKITGLRSIACKRLSGVKGKAL